ncbi:unnamed protein product, partial [Allacma fusca]
MVDVKKSSLTGSISDME